MNSDSYYFECLPQQREKIYQLNPAPCVYREQRRQEFRLVIPSGLSAIFKIQGSGAEVFSVTDLSQTGLQLIAALDRGKGTFAFNKEDQLTGEFFKS